MMERVRATRPKVPKRRLRPLRSYQNEAFEYQRQTPHPALLLEMRLGKTLIVIRALQQTPGRFLIVAPSSALGSWIDELAKEGIPEDEIAILQGTKKKRRALLIEGRRWNLINWEGHRALPEISRVPWEAVVIDESTVLKNTKAAVTKFFLRNFRDVPRRWILTGTVNPESDLDIFCQLAFLDGRAFGCRNFWNFSAKYYKPNPTGFGWVPRRGTPGKIRKELGERAFILRRKDCGMDVPVVHQKRRIEMPSKWRAMYNKIEAEFATPEAETKYAAARYHWMRKLCGGFLDGELVWPGKLGELLYLLQNDLRGEPVVVWFYYNDELFAVEEALRKRKYCVGIIHGAPMSPQKRRGVVHDFQRERLQVLLAQQAVAQMGQNFSRADTALYYSTPTGGLARRQTQDRIVDVSQKTTNLVLDLIVPNSVDEDAVEIALGKGMRSAWTLERARKMAMARRGR